MQRRSFRLPDPALPTVSSALALPRLKIGEDIRPLRARSIRVAALIVAIIAMSLGDLAMTLAFLRSVGMGEANPLARLVIGYNSPALLVVWKCASVLLACLIFARYRHRLFTEAACWAAVAVLAGLTVHWSNYTSQASELAQTMPLAFHTHESPEWVRITDE